MHILRELGIKSRVVSSPMCILPLSCCDEYMADKLCLVEFFCSVWLEYLVFVFCMQLCSHLVTAYDNYLAIIVEPCSLIFQAHGDCPACLIIASFASWKGIFFCVNEGLQHSPSCHQPKISLWMIGLFSKYFVHQVPDLTWATTHFSFCDWLCTIVAHGSDCSIS